MWNDHSRPGTDCASDLEPGRNRLPTRLCSVRADLWDGDGMSGSVGADSGGSGATATRSGEKPVETATQNETLRPHGFGDERGVFNRW
jgi:hypothetical protein